MLEGGEDVLVALSGGIDSTATVLLLRSKGLLPRAVYFNNLGDNNLLEKVTNIASKLALKLDIIDAREYFQNTVVEYLKTELNAGRTPAPCAFCNAHLKWKLLVDTADRLGIKHIATGHYAHIDASHGFPLLKRGADKIKDQTYYLWNVTPNILERTILPLGDKTKMEVRNYLIDSGFGKLGQAPESMSLCFLPPNVAYPDFVKTIIPTSPGNILDVHGHTIGTHDGYPLYTIGQQRGLNIQQAGKYAVVKICPGDNTLIVSPQAIDLYTRTLIVRDYVAHSQDVYGEGISVLVRGLGRNPEGFARIARVGEKLFIELESPAWAVAPGQPVVFYKGDLLLGGGYAE